MLAFWPIAVLFAARAVAPMPHAVLEATPLSLPAGVSPRASVGALDGQRGGWNTHRSKKRQTAGQQSAAGKEGDAPDQHIPWPAQSRPNASCPNSKSSRPPFATRPVLDTTLLRTRRIQPSRRFRRSMYQKCHNCPLFDAIHPKLTKYLRFIRLQFPILRSFWHGASERQYRRCDAAATPFFSLGHHRSAGLSPRCSARSAPRLVLMAAKASPSRPTRAASSSPTGHSFGEVWTPSASASIAEPRIPGRGLACLCTDEGSRPAGKSAGGAGLFGRPPRRGSRAVDDRRGRRLRQAPHTPFPELEGGYQTDHLLKRGGGRK